VQHQPDFARISGAFKMIELDHGHFLYIAALRLLSLGADFDKSSERSVKLSDDPSAHR
jgi:hypothetical protein